MITNDIDKILLTKLQLQHANAIALQMTLATELVQALDALTLGKNTITVERMLDAMAEAQLKLDTDLTKPNLAHLAVLLYGPDND